MYCIALQNELVMKWNAQLLTMRCCVIEGKKFSILPNREKGKWVVVTLATQRVLLFVRRSLLQC